MPTLSPLAVPKITVPSQVTIAFQKPTDQDSPVKFHAELISASCTSCIAKVCSTNRCSVEIWSKFSMIIDFASAIQPLPFVLLCGSLRNFADTPQMAKRRSLGDVPKASQRTPGCRTLLRHIG